MRRSISVLSVLAAAALAACSGSGAPLSSVSLPGVTPAVAPRAPAASKRHLLTLSAMPPPSTTTPSHIKSWLSPSLKSAKSTAPLIFVTDASYGTVNIFSFPYLNLEAVITGFSIPEGECTDRTGNVWMMEDGNNTLVQLSRTGSIIKTLADTAGFPSSCAINPKNGDLAVTNIENDGYADGSVSIYKNASGTPTQLTCSGLAEYFFDGFDDNGDLALDGITGNDDYEACYGSESSLSPLAVEGATIYWPGAVVWSSANKYWDFFDQNCQDINNACAYWLKVSHQTATNTGVTDFISEAGGPVCDLVQAVLSPKGNSYVGGVDYEGGCNYTQSGVYTWNYPSGELPESIWQNSNYISYPIGAAITPNK
jgi:hypothetical protein